MMWNSCKLANKIQEAFVQQETYKYDLEEDTLLPNHYYKLSKDFGMN